MSPQEINPKLYNWASQLDPNAMLQAAKASHLPCVERVALMPDAHVGMGATVGSVIGTNDAIIPAAVGVDIGCGMAAVRFDMTASQLPDDLSSFMPAVEEAIPAGVGQGHLTVTRQAEAWYQTHRKDFTTNLDQRLTGKLLEQFGSLGSGNHFFEVCLDEQDAVWIVLHSGSRGLGNILAQDHIKVARAMMKARGVKLEDPDLAYLLDGEAEFGLYIGDMLACQAYAAGNRQLMLERSVDAFREFLGLNVPVTMSINCHHNFTQRETHGDHDLWVTRKGAIKADVGDLGVIPGSMGTRSYIVRGLGNPLSYNSCSHGAGRVHSRSAAKKLFTEDDLATAMEGKVWLDKKATALLDEIPAAYKDIDQVMADQADLVETVHVLSQILNYKGA